MTYTSVPINLYKQTNNKKKTTEEKPAVDCALKLRYAIFS